MNTIIFFVSCILIFTFFALILLLSHNESTMTVLVDIFKPVYYKSANFLFSQRESFRENDVSQLHSTGSFHMPYYDPRKTYGPNKDKKDEFTMWQYRPEETLVSYEFYQENLPYDVL